MLNILNGKQLYGRVPVTTNRKITGNIDSDIRTVKLILNECLPIHNQNAFVEKQLMRIYHNANNWWEKEKKTRHDINNRVGIPTAYAATRTINGYSLNEPIKYVARDADGGEEKQKEIEALSAMLDSAHNNTATKNAAETASICGLGYKLVLPANEDEYEDTGIPFVIRDKLIDPQNAFVVVSDDVIPKDVMGVMIGTYYNDEQEPSGNLYTCWTKYHQIVLKDSDVDETGFEVVPQIDKRGNSLRAYEWLSRRIPLVEIERNAFRKGDWEVALDLMELKNKLLSNREDDIEQVLDYVLVLINCGFEEESEKKEALQNRLFELKTKDPMNKPSVEILKNALDQSGVQLVANYIDLLIQESIGIPNRQESGNGGGDTGQAVQYRNGFRDLENNAAKITSKMDDAELKFLSVCIAYCKDYNSEKVRTLKPYDIRCKFTRSMNDDIVSSANAFATYQKYGLATPDALLLSKSGTDAAELATRAEKAFENGTSYLARTLNSSTTTQEGQNNNPSTTNTGEDLVDTTSATAGL